MLRMVVCDWNRTLFRDLFEESYFGGICWRVFLRALGRGDFRRALALGRMGADCFRLFYRAWADRGRALEHIARITERINRDAICGLPWDFVERFTRDFARRAVRRIDRRLLDPLAEARRRHGVRLAVISSGSRLGIRRALARAGCGFDFVLANDFRMAGEGSPPRYAAAGGPQTVAALELRIMANKAEVLAGLLAREGLDAGEVMYVGDSGPDAACLRRVGWPVVSFLARPEVKRRFAKRYGAFVPAREEDFRRHLERACT